MRIISFFELFMKSMHHFPINGIFKKLSAGFHCPQFVIRCLFFLFLPVVPFSFVYADDPGITKVRLKQLNDTSYMLEADIPQILLSTIKTPLLPDRFRFIEFSYDDKSGWITQRATFTTSGSPLSSEDEIILPWNRNGVDFTVQWIDGTIYKKLYYRTLDGIHIPMKDLLPKVRTSLEVLHEGFLLGIKHFWFLGIHFLMVFLLTWNYPACKALRFLFCFSLGQGIALILSELNVTGLDLLFSDILLIVISFVIAYSTIYQKKFRSIWLALIIVGLVHGLSFSNELKSLDLLKMQRVQAMFAFMLSIDLIHFLLAIPLLLILPRIKKSKKLEELLPIVAGSISVCMLILVFQDHIKKGETQILNLQESDQIVYSAPKLSNTTNTKAKRGTGKMNTPVMTFLSIEPFEVRQEILIQAKVGIQAIGADDKLTRIIPIEYQEEFKKQLDDELLKSFKLSIDGKKSKPSNKKIDFVTMNRGGVSVRAAPVDENLEEAIIGITLIYDTPSLADSVVVDWGFFTENLQRIEASAVDPFGAFSVNLTPMEHTLSWANKLKAYSVPVIESVTVREKNYPFASLVIWVLVLIYIMYLKIKSNATVSTNLIIILYFVGFLLYPFVRTELRIPYLSHEKPTKERTQLIINDLLTNVYRAFDRKKEEEVYNSLALSVIGDQLADIYIQNRKAMELENRGGAKASVDEVKTYEIFDISRSDKGGFVTDAIWTVTGSVNHFGHTHYRQNQYRALVTFIQEKDTWKISHIEPIDEQRIY